MTGYLLCESLIELHHSVLYSTNYLVDLLLLIEWLVFKNATAMLYIFGSQCYHMTCPINKVPFIDELHSPQYKFHGSSFFPVMFIMLISHRIFEPHGCIVLLFYNNHSQHQVLIFRLKGQ